MIILIRKLFVQFLLFAVVLCAAYVGISGSEVAAVNLFGEEYFKGPFTPLSPRLWLAVLFMVLGCITSVFGAIILIVLPVATWLPDECRAFKHKPSKKLAGILRWFSIALEKQAKEVERDA